LRRRIPRFPLPAVFTVIAGVLLFAAGSPLAGVLGSPHDFSKTSLITTYKNTPIATAGVCSICHIPHDALYGALWPRDLLSTYDNALGMNGGTGSTDKPSYKRSVTVQCFDCHDSHVTTDKINDVPAFNAFETNHKPQNIAFGFTKGGSTDSGSTMKEDGPAGTVSGYYENNPPYATSPTTYYGADSSSGSPFKRPLDNVTLPKSGGHYFKSQNPSATVYKGDKLGCSECHDPHAWDPSNKDWHAFFLPAKLYGYPTRTSRWTGIFGSSNPRASTFMANPVLSGGQSRSDVDSRKPCILCHGDSNSTLPVSFNDINSDYSSSTPIIRPPTTIGEHASGSSVACVSCHDHNAIGANCTQCHGFPPSSTASPAYPVTAASTFVPSPNPGVADSHPRHYGGSSGQPRNGIYQFDCGICHFGSALGTDPTLQQHQNAWVSVVIDGDWTKAPNGSGPFGAWDNTNYYNQANGFGGRTGQLDNGTSATGWGAGGGRYGGNTCRNVYCHSAGRVVASMALDCTVDFPRPLWNSGQQHCNDCHGFGTDNVGNGGINWGMPNYVGGTVGGDNANTHAIHVVTNRYECSVCHFLTVTGAGGNRAILGPFPSKHVNGIREVAFDGTNATGTYDNSPATKTCHVSCHGTDVPRWGGTVAGCVSCHLATGPDSDIYLTATDNIYSSNIAGNIDNAEWMYSGHGKTTLTYDVSLNPAANLMAGGSGGGDACYYCHDPYIPHRTAANPFRLKDQTGAAAYLAGKAWNATCLVCHFHSSTPTQDLPVGYDPDNAAGVYTLKRATASFVDNAHYGAEHTATFNGGQFCWDCHDPHGDRPSTGVNNIYMLQGGSARSGSAVGKLLQRSDGVYGIRGSSGVLTANAPVFTATTSGTNYADNTTFLGVCQVCHTQGTTGHYRWNFGDGHNQGTRCTQCHLHNGAFAGTGGPDVGQFFDRLSGPTNFADNSSHPLRGLTTSDNTLLYGGQNCLGCHYVSGPSKAGDECLKCHFEFQPNAPAGNHMDKTLQLATVSGNSLPSSQFTIGTIQQYDNWCLQCHQGTATSLGGVFPSAARRTVIDPAAFSAGRHRAQSPPVGCIYCHAPHGSGNARLVRINPANRGSAGATPMEFGVFPADNTGGYVGQFAASPNEVRPYRARVDNTLPNVFADADDENAFCNKACHLAKVSANFVKDKPIKRDGTTGNYLLTPANKKIYLINGGEYTNDNIANFFTNPHQHPDGEVIDTDNMVRDYANLIGLSGPTFYKYPGTGNANPAAFTSAVNAANAASGTSLPLFPDFNGDGNRDFTNAWNNLGARIVYRYTCSTCHNPHGTTDTTGNTSGGDSYPDIRLKKSNPNALCSQCHI
jgi:predicted CxxxxCH...CXXCH cytochrome family protein